MFKRSTTWCVLIYGILIAMLGYLGYQNTGSQISLFAGGGFGVLLILSSLVMFLHHRWGGFTALLLTLILTGVFAFRYSVTHKSIPAILAVLSGGMLLFLLAQVPKWKR